MGFLADLASQIDTQMSTGENNNHSLDSVIDGQNISYGSLGDFAKNFDKSAERRYLESGFLRNDPFNATPKQLEINVKAPSATVFIKKKMFSSVANNFRPDFMDQDEKLYYKAMVVLFQNKCLQISALEKLSKIQKITSASGSIDDQLMPLIISLSDTISTGSVGNVDITGGSGVSSGASSSKLAQVVDKVRRLYAFNITNPTTTWISDSTNIFKSQFGTGTGVIEITNFTSLTTSVSVDSIKNPQSFNLSINDPYESMVITEWDIEKAIADATNVHNSLNSTQFGKRGADETINDLQNRLNRFRSTRGVSPISTRANPDTLLGRRVTAILDRLGIELLFDYDSTGGTGFPGLGGFGNSVSIAPEYQIGGAAAGNDGLDPKTGTAGIGPDNNIKQLAPESELSLFQSLISAHYNKIQLEANSRNLFQVNNKNTNYARKKLRFNFNGKLIIQPMDVIHVYISSKNAFDTKLLGGLTGLFNGLGVVQNLNNAIAGVKSAAASLFDPSNNFTFQAEKQAFVGADFPNYLWASLRSQFISEKEGTHVFAGVVETANDSWDDGKFSVSVAGKDNTFYFDQGKINFIPGLDTYCGSMFDPLTPYKSNFDTISSNTKDQYPELLNENIDILGTLKDNTSMCKAKSGSNPGSKVTSDNVKNDVIVSKNKLSSHIFYAPDGLVYKWKEGIGVFVQFGDSSQVNDGNSVGAVTANIESFAGQDVMNVISLLICGQPYNYATFFKTSLETNGADSSSRQSYTTYLLNSLTKSNAL